MTCPVCKIEKPDNFKVVKSLTSSAFIYCSNCHCKSEYRLAFLMTLREFQGLEHISEDDIRKEKPDPITKDE